MNYANETSMRPPGNQVPPNTQHFSLLMTAFIDIICYLSIIGYRIMVKTSDKCSKIHSAGLAITFSPFSLQSWTKL